jgi:hypothetical protein
VLVGVVVGDGAADSADLGVPGAKRMSGRVLRSDEMEMGAYQAL